MNKLEANISLLLITFFASIQYAFLAGVPAEVSQFSFLCVTNLVGFLIMLLFFYRELACPPILCSFRSWESCFSRRSRTGAATPGS